MKRKRFSTEQIVAALKQVELGFEAAPVSRTAQRAIVSTTQAYQCLHPFFHDS
jgi:hypothetical protein